MERKDLPDILYRIIKDLGGSATMMEIFRKFWTLHGKALKENEDLLLFVERIIKGSFNIANVGEH